MKPVSDFFFVFILRPAVATGARTELSPPVRSPCSITDLGKLLAVPNPPLHLRRRHDANIGALETVEAANGDIAIVMDQAMSYKANDTS